MLSGEAASATAGICGSVFFATSVEESSTSTTPPNSFLTKFLMPLNTPEIVSVIGLKKLPKLSKRDLSVSSPNKPKDTKLNIPPKPETIASEKLPVSWYFLKPAVTPLKIVPIIARGRKTFIITFFKAAKLKIDLIPFIKLLLNIPIIESRRLLGFSVLSPSAVTSFAPSFSL